MTVLKEDYSDFFQTDFICIFAKLITKFYAMKILLDIPDSKAYYLLELLKNISYVKVKPITDAKAKLMGEIREAVEEMKLVRAGKKKARNAEDFFNEL